MASTFNSYLGTFMIISCCILPIRRQFSDKSFRENQNTLLIFNKFLSETRAVYEITKMKYGRTRQTTDDNIILHLHFACQMNKARIQAHTQNM